MAKLKKTSTFYATISITIVLVLVSLFLTLFLHTGNITNILKQNINLLVEVQDVLPESEVNRILQIVKNTEGVIGEQVEFIKKEDALIFMSSEFGKLAEEIENPFKNIIKFNLKPDYYTEKNIEKIKEVLELEKGVLGFYHENESIDMVKNNLTNFSWIVLGLAGIFVLLSVAIIYTTLRLTLYADEKKIMTMQIVGATGSFIRKPYYVWAFQMSLTATFFVILVLGGLYSYALLYNSLLIELLEIRFLILTVCICFLIALIITTTATNVILRRFLHTART
jgi:cell division transport system permease protein